MAEPFEDIVIKEFAAPVDFTAMVADQDSETPPVFDFRFLLSRSAPELWVKIAREEIGHLEWVRISSNEIVCRCTSDDAQGISEQLNTQVLPGVNQEYRAEAAVARSRQDAENTQREQILSDVAKAIRDQK